MVKRALLAAVALLALLTLLGAPAHAQEGEALTHEAEECIALLEEGNDVDDCQEAPSPILPATNELIWGAISFALLVFALWKFAWPGMKKGMEGRTERIRSSLDQAESAKAEAENLLTDYRSQLADAKSETNRIIEEARQSAEAVRRDLVARAEAEAAEMRQRNAEQISAERDRVMGEMQTQVSTLAIELAEKVVGANLDREANMRLIEDYINTVGQSGSRS